MLDMNHKSPEQFCEVEKSLEVTIYTILLTILQTIMNGKANPEKTANFRKKLTF